jgi:hypothetical protein
MRKKTVFNTGNYLSILNIDNILCEIKNMLYLCAAYHLETGMQLPDLLAFLSTTIKI